MTTSAPQERDDFADRLDRSFGDGPPAPPLGLTVRAGRRALARRRALGGLSALAVVAAVGVGLTLIQGGGTPTSGDLPPADQPVATDTATASETCAAPAGEPADGCAVATETDVGEARAVPSDPDAAVELLADGTLARAVGVEITERVPNPLDRALPDRSLGIEYTRDGDTTWALLDFTDMGRLGSGGGVSEVPARQSFATLQDWLDDQVALQSGTTGIQLVRFGDGEELLPRPGVEILEQRSGIDVGASFAGPDDPTAVAVVRFQGSRWYVLARRIAGSRPDYIPTDARVGGATLDDFLAYARQQYAEGGGGLR